MLGAVNIPLEETVPPLADHVTALLVVPVTVAANCFVAPALTAAEAGLIETTTVCGAAVTVTLAVADFVESAALVALTV